MFHRAGLTKGGKAYHDRNAIMKPNVEKKKVRPYLLTGLNTGTERALWFNGLTFGAFHSTWIRLSIVLAAWDWGFEY